MINRESDEAWLLWLVKSSYTCVFEYWLIVNPSRLIIGLYVRESRLLYFHIYIFTATVFKEIFDPVEHK